MAPICEAKNRASRPDDTASPLNSFSLARIPSTSAFAARAPDRSCSTSAPILIWTVLSATSHLLTQWIAPKILLCVRLLRLGHALPLLLGQLARLDAELDH